jgi:hypothetical protein
VNPKSVRPLGEPVNPIKGATSLSPDRPKSTPASISIADSPTSINADWQTDKFRLKHKKKGMAKYLITIDLVKTRKCSECELVIEFFRFNQ